MKAKNVIPIHSSKSEMFDAKNARAVRGKKAIVLEPGQKTGLEPSEAI